MNIVRPRICPSCPLLSAAGLIAVAAFAVAIPHARADSEPCAYAISVASGTATDPETGLTWRLSPANFVYDWLGARDYCVNLNGGFRLPTIQELQTLVHEGRYHPAIDTNTFVDGSTGFFWSSTPLAANPGFAWGVYFEEGNAGPVSTGAFNDVRCVK
jgi:hypothetical protein